MLSKFNFKAKLGGQLSNVLDMEYAKKDLIKINTSVCYAMRSEKGFSFHRISIWVTY